MLKDTRVFASVRKRTDGYGNTYHSVKGYIVEGKKQTMFKVIECYGYGNQYITTIKEYFKKNNNIELEYNQITIIDVANVKTLKELRFQA